MRRFAQRQNFFFFLGGVGVKTSLTSPPPPLSHSGLPNFHVARLAGMHFVYFHFPISTFYIEYRITGNIVNGFLGFIIWCLHVVVMKKKSSPLDALFAKHVIRCQHIVIGITMCSTCENALFRWKDVFSLAITIASQILRGEFFLIIFLIMAPCLCRRPP